MENFNGMTKIELEMMRDHINKVLPSILALVPTFALLVKANHEELKKLDYDGNEAIIIAVQSTAKQLGLS